MSNAAVLVSPVYRMCVAVTAMPPRSSPVMPSCSAMVHAFTSMAAMLHCSTPSRLTHAPATHSSPSLHCVSQSPHAFRLVFVSTHRPPHTSGALAGHTHAAFLHDAPSAHAMPQPPQF